MKNIVVVLFWSALLYSCKEVSFPQAQPAGISALKEVPAELRGVYQVRDRKTGELGDTLIIEAWGYRAKDKDQKDWLTNGSLSDTLVLKTYQNYYFVNFKTNNQWVLRVIQREANGNLLFMNIDIGEEKKEKEIIRKLRKKLSVKEQKYKSDTFYQINPTQEELVALIKEGYFTGIRLLKVR
ncbi:MAG: hypothetical protein ACK5BJ_08045 [Bacteroidota bacterium]|jgi:hypothetical protein|nr:hypothetical protein [Flammeovirgaceae bacterium]